MTKCPSAREPAPFSTSPPLLRIGHGATSKRSAAARQVRLDMNAEFAGSRKQTFDAACYSREPSISRLLPQHALSRHAAHRSAMNRRNGHRRTIGRASLAPETSAHEARQWPRQAVLSLLRLRKTGSSVYPYHAATMNHQRSQHHTTIAIVSCPILIIRREPAHVCGGLRCSPDDPSTDRTC